MLLISRYNMSTLADNHALMAKEGSHLLLIDLSKRYDIHCKCWLRITFSTTFETLTHTNIFLILLMCDIQYQSINTLTPCSITGTGNR